MKQTKFEELIETFALPSFEDALGKEDSDKIEDVREVTKENVNEIKTSILNTQALIDEQTSEIEKKARILEDKQKQIFGQSKEIEEKVKLLDTRNRMLQLSIDRNIYKKKLIYSLLAVIIGLVVLMLFFYSYFNNVMKT